MSAGQPARGASSGGRQRETGSGCKVYITVNLRTLNAIRCGRWEVTVSSSPEYTVSSWERGGPEEYLGGHSLRRVGSDMEVQEEARRASS